MDFKYELLINIAKLMVSGLADLYFSFICLIFRKMF
jgi:hypothetical protein